MNNHKLKYDEKTLKSVIDKIVKRTMQVDFTWDWPCGVAFYGICKAWEVTQNKDYLDFLINWVDEYLEIRYQFEPFQP